MSSDKVGSVMHSDSKTELEQFSWRKILDEVSVNAPVLLNVLTAASKIKTTRSNTQAVIGLCIAILQWCLLSFTMVVHLNRFINIKYIYIYIYSCGYKSFFFFCLGLYKVAKIKRVSITQDTYLSS